MPGPGEVTAQRRCLSGGAPGRLAFQGFGRAAGPLLLLLSPLSLLLAANNGASSTGPGTFFPNPASEGVPSTSSSWPPRRPVTPPSPARSGWPRGTTRTTPARYPLILQVGQRLNAAFPPSAHAFSAAWLADRPGRRPGSAPSAIGYTLYVGSPRRDEDLAHAAPGPPGP